jgi:hypothetical protein
MSNPYIGNRENKIIAFLTKRGWERLPKPGQAFYGLTGGKISELCRGGAIKTIVIRREKFGCDGELSKKGIRMFYKPSLDEYLRKFTDDKDLDDIMAELDAMNALSIGTELAKPTQAYVFNIGRWVRLPKGKESLCGLRRGTIYQLCLVGKIRSIKLSNVAGKQQKRGIRLLYLPSLYAYLDKLADEQAEKLELSKNSFIRDIQ